MVRVALCIAKLPFLTLFGERVGILRFCPEAAECYNPRPQNICSLNISFLHYNGL